MTTTNPFTRVRVQQEIRRAALVDRAKTFLRNTIAQSPDFGRQFTVVSIDTEPQDPDMLWLHLSDGTTIIVTLEVEDRE